MARRSASTCTSPTARTAARTATSRSRPSGRPKAAATSPRCSRSSSCAPPRSRGLAAVSVYLGGGTPSLWDPDEVAALLEALRARLALPGGAEVTIEANPESTDRARLRAWRAAGVNRVSVGVQSFDPGVLAKLGRRHGPDAAERAIREAAEEIGNVSVDLIYGARRSTLESARGPTPRGPRPRAPRTCRRTRSRSTRRSWRRRCPSRGCAARDGCRSPPTTTPPPRRPPSAPRCAAPACAVTRSPTSRGRDGSRCTTGSTGAPRATSGSAPAPTAASAARRGPTRYGNLRDAGAYLDAALAGRLPTAEEDRIDAAAERNERVMLGLRTRDGVPLTALSPTQAREAGDARRAPARGPAGGGARPHEPGHGAAHVGRGAAARIGGCDGEHAARSWTTCWTSCRSPGPWRPAAMFGGHGLYAGTPCSGSSMTTSCSSRPTR